MRNLFGRDVRQYWNYRELMADREVDAVMISTPDHLHAAQLHAAAIAGKHVYVENPLGTDLPSALRAVDAAVRAGIIVQVGTHRRSLPGVAGAREIVRSGGIGRLSRVDESRNDDRPFWYQNLERDVREADVHWQEFLGDRAARPFDGRIYAAWLGYYDFCHGPVAQWGAHYLDVVHYVADAGFPLSCVCLGGASYPPDENRFTAPDNLMATWTYADGLVVTSSNNFCNGGGNFRRFYGERGTLDLTNWNTPVYGPNANPRRDATLRSQSVPLVERPDHYLDWLQCLRSGRTPHAPLASGYQHTVAVLMAALSYETGKKTTYHPQARRIETV